MKKVSIAFRDGGETIFNELKEQPAVINGVVVIKISDADIRVFPLDTVDAMHIEEITQSPDEPITPEVINGGSL